MYDVPGDDVDPVVEPEPQPHLHTSRILTYSYSVMQSDRISFCGDVVFNMAYRDETNFYTKFIKSKYFGIFIPRWLVKAVQDENCSHAFECITL